MPHNAEIRNLIDTIALELSPLSAHGPDHQLWTIYYQLQEWKFAIEWQHPGIGNDRSAEIAACILINLEALPDRKLANNITRIVTRKMKAAACGRLVSDWIDSAEAIPETENSYAAAPAAR